MRFSFSRFNILFLAGTTFIHPAFAASPVTIASAGTPLAAMLEQATDLRRRAEYRQAVSAYEQLLSLPAISQNVEFHAYVIDEIADVEIELGVYGQAEIKASEALALLRQARITDTGTYALTERILADALHAEGYYEQAKEVAENALSLGRQTLDPLSPNLGFLLTTLGLVMKDLGKFDRAEQLCESGVVP